MIIKSLKSFTSNELTMRKNSIRDVNEKIAKKYIDAGYVAIANDEEENKLEVVKKEETKEANKEKGVEVSEIDNSNKKSK